MDQTKAAEAARSENMQGEPKRGEPRFFGPDEVDARWPPSWKDEESANGTTNSTTLAGGTAAAGRPADVSEPIRLTESEHAAQRKAAIRGLFNAVVVQMAVSITVALVALVVAGAAAGVSALIGAAVYAIPNALFAFRLIVSVNKPGGANPVTFFLGEFFKIAFAGLLIVAAASVGHEVLVWPAFLAGLIFALKSQWLALAFGRKDPQGA
jgi:ATP synthase protein I